MRYVHCFYSKLNKEQIISAMNDIEKIIQNGTDENGCLKGGKVGNPFSFDENKEIPICDRESSTISFNGDVNLELGIERCRNSGFNYDSLIIAPFDGDDFEFCETAGRPYDKLVVATLFRLGYLFPQAFNWESDGNFIEKLGIEIDDDGTLLEDNIHLELSNDLKAGFQLVWQTFHQKLDVAIETTIGKLLMPLEEFKNLDEKFQEVVIERIIQEWID